MAVLLPVDVEMRIKHVHLNFFGFIGHELRISRGEIVRQIHSFLFVNSDRVEPSLLLLFLFLFLLLT